MSYQNSGSFREFVGKEDVFLAPVLKWAIGPKTQATFELEYNHQHSGLDAAFVPFINGKLLNMPRGRNYAEYSPSTTEAVLGSFNWSHQFNDDWSIKHRFTVNHQTNDLSLTAASGVDDNGNVTRYQFGSNFKLNTYSTNLDLIGHFDTAGLKHTLLFGGDYYRIDKHEIGLLNLVDAISFANNESLIDLNNPVHPGSPFPGRLQPSFLENIQTDLYGLYIQDQIKLPYGFQVMGGIRYQYLHQKALNQGLGLLASPPDYTTQTDDAVTPRVGFLWQPQSWISLYANYVESFGANTGKLLTNRPVPSTSAEQYEGGIKTEFFGGRLRATLAYFDLTKNNVATPHPNLAFAKAGYSVITGAARSRGPELDITGEILPGWNVIATYANLDTKVLQTNDNSNGQTPMIGSRFFNAPRNTGSIWSTYEILDGDFKGIKIGGGATFRDGQIGCCDTPSYKIPGYATVDLLAAYSLDVGKTKITAQLNINNLLDKHYFAGIFTQKDNRNGGVDFGQPRTFMGAINVQY
ncbi:MAG: TonB-dependent receptor [Methyloglobulus sp.]